jgi:hypothetical protein
VGKKLKTKKKAGFVRKQIRSYQSQEGGAKKGGQKSHKERGRE